MAAVSGALAGPQRPRLPPSPRFGSIKVVDVCLDGSLRTIDGLSRYRVVQALVRMNGAPLGWARVPVHGDRCLATSQRRAILGQLWRPLVTELVRQRLERLGPSPDALGGAPSVGFPAAPTISVAVCSRDRSGDLLACLDSLEHLEPPPLEVIVVDNAPTTDATRRLVMGRGPTFRYLCEPRPGLDWARNRALASAAGEVVAFTDDDCVVDPSWVGALARAFAESSDVAAVTGLVVPFELETQAQILFEEYGGFGRGFKRRWYRVGPRGRSHVPAGNLGTGANMAFRRSVIESIGDFDPALDVGTPTNGGGDIEMFFRVLQEEHVLVYEPSAIIRHRHRRDMGSLHRQLADHGTGFYSYATRSLLAYPQQWRSFAWFLRWWWTRWILRRVALSFLRPNGFPRALVWAEARGALLGPSRYRCSKRIATRMAQTPAASTEREL